MDIKDLQKDTKKVDVAGVITAKEAERTVNFKAGGTGRVCNATLKDSSGEVKLVLWGADIDRVAENSTVAVSNGFMSEYQGKLQLNVGKYGKLLVDGQ